MVPVLFRRSVSFVAPSLYTFQALSLFVSTLFFSPPSFSLFSIHPCSQLSLVLSVCLYACTYLCVYVCTYAYVCMYVCIHLPHLRRYVLSTPATKHTAMQFSQLRSLLLRCGHQPSGRAHLRLVSGHPGRHHRSTARRRALVFVGLTHRTRRSLRGQSICGCGQVRPEGCVYACLSVCPSGYLSVCLSVFESTRTPHNRTSIQTDRVNALMCMAQRVANP